MHPVGELLGVRAETFPHRHQIRQVERLLQQQASDQGPRSSPSRCRRGSRIRRKSQSADKIALLIEDDQRQNRRPKAFARCERISRFDAVGPCWPKGEVDQLIVEEAVDYPTRSEMFSTDATVRRDALAER